MGIFDGIKEKIDASKARKELERQEAAYQSEHQEWEHAQTGLSKIVEALGKIGEGEDLVSTSAILKKGEISIWTGHAVLHEARKGAGHFEGQSNGMSFRIAKGVTYRVGATRGTYVSGPETQTILDNGIVLLTNNRLLFTGTNQTKEWAFEKWLGAECNEAQTDYLFHVSNRQKASGITFLVNGRTPDYETGREFNQFLTVAMNLQRKEPSEMLKEYKKELADHAKAEPVKALPASPTTSTEE